MADKKQFKAESQRLLDLMINSIYTHKEIFLRELISNASDASDKLYYKALTEKISGISRDDLSIQIVLNKDHRMLSIIDQGIGMNADELEEHLGTIANSEASSNALWNGANYSLYNTEVGSYIGVADVDFGDDGASMVSMKLSDTSMTEYKECVAALNKKVTGKHTVYFVFEKTNVLTDSWKFNK